MKLRSNQNVENLKKWEQLTFENRPRRQILMVWLMKNESKKNEIKLSQKNNVYTNSWCNSFYSHGW